MITTNETKLLDPEALRLLALYRQNQHGPLLNEVDALAKAGPLTPGVLGLASLSCSALERYDQGVNAANQALQQEPQWPWLFAALALGEAGQHQLDRAIFAQQQAFRLMPGDPGYAAALARYLREAGQLEAALRTARQSLVVSPAHASLRIEYGLTLLASGDSAEALSQFREAQALAPDDPAGYVNEGVLHLRAGARKEARQALGAALKRQPDLTMAEDRMAETFVGDRGVLRAVVGHLLTLARVTLIGWLIIIFAYYLTFRLLQFIWRLAPATLPVGQGLLLVTLAWLAGGMLLGRALRVWLRLTPLANGHPGSQGQKSNQ